MLHRVGIRSATEDLEAFAAQQLVGLDRVILVPDPVGIAQASSRLDGVGERLLGNHPVSDERVAILEATVLGSGDREQDFVSLLLETKREPESGVVPCCNDEAHGSE